jgi:hypothetical protein
MNSSPQENIMKPTQLGASLLMKSTQLDALLLTEGFPNDTKSTARDTVISKKVWEIST